MRLTKQNIERMKKIGKVDSYEHFKNEILIAGSLEISVNSKSYPLLAYLEDEDVKELKNIIDGFLSLQIEDLKKELSKNDRNSAPPEKKQEPKKIVNRNRKKEKMCYCCGKSIDFEYKYDLSTYCYKKNFGKSVRYFCSYGCMSNYKEGGAKQSALCS